MTGMTYPIYVSLGNKRYVGGTITAADGKDITGATFQIALAAPSTVPPAAAAFAAPDVSAQGATPADRTVLKLVDSGIPVGTYYVWGRIIDSSEIEPLLFDQIVVA